MNSLMCSFKKLFVMIGLFVIPIDAPYHIKVFTRLMLEGNVFTAVCWLTEHCGGSVLKPSDSTTIGGNSMTVLEALGF